MLASLVPLLSGVLVTGAGSAVRLGRRLDSGSPTLAVQARVVGTGTVAATVQIEFSNDAVHWLVGATITLSDTTSAQDGVAPPGSVPWGWVRANCTAISGTGAALTVNAGMG